MFNFENFILTVDDLFTTEECNRLINFFEKSKQLGLTVTSGNERHIPHQRSDEVLFTRQVLESDQLHVEDTAPVRAFNDKFWGTVFPNYMEEYSILGETKHASRHLKIQKTLIGQGYHRWHYETSTMNVTRRVLAFQLYLNTVDEGGETEFLYYPKRIKAQAGRLIMWPAGFTHTHRGNPPISGEKYVLTGWTELVE
jgi:hypothetical protein